MSIEEKELEAVAAETAEEIAPQTEESAAAESAQEKPAKRQPRRQHKAIDKAVWDKLKEQMEDGEILTVKVNSAVKAGVTAMVEGVRGFIPASLLSVDYVENLDEWVNKSVDVKVIKVEPDENRLVLSGKAVEQEKKSARFDNLSVGEIFEGVVERIVPFGVFVKFNEGLSGLVHISQIANRRVEKPEDVVAIGDSVKVKVINKKDGKIGLSMKQADESYTARPARAPRGDRGDRERSDREPREYKEEASIGTSLGDMLKGINLD